MNFATENLVFDPQIIRRFDVNGPRYTSYPTADRFVEAFDSDAAKHWLGKRNIGGISRPLSLYFHIPFCNTICYYCACNKIITKDHGRSAKYIRYLGREIDIVGGLIEGGPKVEQLHWGGGTPTFLARDEMATLMGMLRGGFEFSPQAEVSIEVDPRKVGADTIAFLAELGFNRISVGIQDFDPVVQEAVNRIQTEAETMTVIAAARANGFVSVNADLIYGLPRQTVAGFSTTLDKVIAVAPDRIALYSYAHVPHLFKPQRRIVWADLPMASAKVSMLSRSLDAFTEAGYVYVGMDHFALPEDALAVAKRQGRLHRNFQGYSTQPDCDLIALGVSAIGRVGTTYSQNAKTLEEYYDRLNQGHLPIVRGLALSRDDLVRRAVIMALMCQGALTIESVEQAWLIDFRTYFARELEQLAEMEQQGLVDYYIS